MVESGLGRPPVCLSALFLRKCRGNLQSDGCVHDLNCSDGFTGAYMLQLVRLYTLSMCRLLYVNDTSIKLWKKKSISYQPFLQGLKDSRERLPGHPPALGQGRITGLGETLTDSAAGFK